MTRRLREEQDAAFRESLAADRERERQREAQRAAAAAKEAAAAEAAAAAKCAPLGGGWVLVGLGCGAAAKEAAAAEAAAAAKCAPCRGRSGGGRWSNASVLPVVETLARSKCICCHLLCCACSYQSACGLAAI